MKTIGIIGGLSPESTKSYYDGLNAGVNKALGGHHNAKTIISSVDFGEFVALKEKGDWETQGRLLAECARGLERAGADFILLATNTMHKMADEITMAINIPFLHIGDATAQRIKAQGLSKIGLLGTKYTMELDFYKARLQAHGIEVVVPDEAGRVAVHDIIYGELCHGQVRDESRQVYQDAVAAFLDQAAQGVILGCTEIGMLLKDGDVDLPLFDTTEIHVEAALAMVLEGV